jgi:hypothetical protein
MKNKIKATNIITKEISNVQAIPQNSIPCISLLHTVIPSIYEPTKQIRNISEISYIEIPEDKHIIIVTDASVQDRNRPIPG